MSNEILAVREPEDRVGQILEITRCVGRLAVAFALVRLGELPIKLASPIFPLVFSTITAVEGEDGFEMFRSRVAEVSGKDEVKN